MPRATMTRLPVPLLLTLVVVASGPTAAAGTGATGGRATYVGGTLDLPERSEGKLWVEDPEVARFTCKHGTVAIPYASIESIEYGQKAGRRVGAAVAVSPLLLLSKKRKHFVTVAYRDGNGTSQGAVFEVAKDAVHAIVTALEARSGKPVIFESDEARVHLGKARR